MIFQRLSERARRRAELRAKERTMELAERMSGALPGGIAARAEAGGICLSGRGLRRRFALDPALRWLTGRLR